MKIEASNLSGPEPAGLRQRLTELRAAVLHLHKTLLEAERISYEASFGKISSPYQFLHLLTNDPWFAWLAPVTQLLMAMDERLDAKEPLTVAGVEALVQQTKEIGDPQDQLQKDIAELKRLENMQVAYRELGNTVPMSAVIQQIQNNMTEGMALSHVSVDVHSEALKGSPFVGAKSAPRLHEVAHLTVVGIASNDVHIAQLIGKLSGNPLFTDVSLNYTRTEILRDYSVRRFEIQMQMDLDPLAAEDPDASPAAPSTQPATAPARSIVQGAPAHAG